jgi:hypothetical protein
MEYVSEMTNANFVEDQGIELKHTTNHDLPKQDPKASQPCDAAAESESRTHYPNSK